jgi:anti-sigma B factor antagonist
MTPSHASALVPVHGLHRSPEQVAHLDEDGHKLSEFEIAGRGMEPAGAYTVEHLAGPAGVATVVLGGELDMASTAELRERLDAAAGLRGLVVDLGEATFIDSAVLKELLRANAELARYETRLILAAISAPVRRLLELTRTEELFTVAPDREAALRELG